ncbi:MAG: hypothetical protein KAH95_12545 [Spirochaetales bacterium]|nr:hypothetical protein [Spirochaetales bacterium]
MRKNTVFWIPEVIEKIFLLLFILSSVVFMTYGIGNFQGFLDSTQLVLLNIFEIIAIILIIVGIYNIIFTTIKIIKLKSKKYIRLGLIISAEVIIIAVYLLVKMISAVSKSVS